MQFIFEHLDAELYEWSLIEYRHISKIVGKNNVVFSNIQKKDSIKLKNYGKVLQESCAEIGLRKICVLSQHAAKTLTTADNKNFDCCIFGGILGDNPAKNRTKEIEDKLQAGKIAFETRNLGIRQMPTDVAVYVAKKILDGSKLENLKFIENVEIEINENECVDLPFRYIIDDNKIIISEELVEHLRKRKEF